MSNLRQIFNVTCSYRDWNSLNYGKIKKLHVCTKMELSALRYHVNDTWLLQGTEMLQYGKLAKFYVCTMSGSVCSKVSLPTYMFVQGI